MKKRAGIYVLSCMMALVVGIAGGVSYSNYRRQFSHLQNRFEMTTEHVVRAQWLTNVRGEDKTVIDIPHLGLESCFQLALTVIVQQFSGRGCERNLLLTSFGFWFLQTPTCPESFQRMANENRS